MEIALTKIKPYCKTDICYEYVFFGKKFTVSFDKCYLDKTKELKTIVFSPSPTEYLGNGYCFFANNILCNLIHKIINDNLTDYKQLTIKVNNNFTEYSIIDKKGSLSIVGVENVKTFSTLIFCLILMFISKIQ